MKPKYDSNITILIVATGQKITLCGQYWDGYKYNYYTNAECTMAISEYELSKRIKDGRTVILT